MKKQNIIILCSFLLLVIVFYLVSCNFTESEEVYNEDFVREEEPSEYVNVNLVGEFYRCGSFKVPKSWTIKMLFDYAGVKELGDVREYDLSLFVEDNKTYYVSKIGSNSIDYDKKVNINTADIDELTTLSGIGEVIALRIISYRQTYPFKSIDEIKNVSGIGDILYEKIKDYITV